MPKRLVVYKRAVQRLCNKSKTGSMRKNLKMTMTRSSAMGSRFIKSAVWSGKAEILTEQMNKLLRKTISYHDYREDFYHAFLAGIFAGAGYEVDSNKEHGEGRRDVVVLDPEGDRVAIFEAKYSRTQDAMPKDCAAALDQIEDRQYAKEFEDDYDSVLCYGIAFYKKRCLVQTKH